MRVALITCAVLAAICGLATVGYCCKGHWTVTPSNAEEGVTGIVPFETDCPCDPYYSFTYQMASGSVTGTYGTYTVACSVTTGRFDGGCGVGHSLSSGYLTSSQKKGYKKSDIAWVPGNVQPHSAPTDNSFQYSATVDCSVSGTGDANNSALYPNGQCYVYGYASGTITGMASDDNFVDGTIDFQEGDSADDTISVKGYSFPISLSSDVETMNKNSSATVGGTKAAVSGDFLKARGWAKGRAYAYYNANCSTLEYAKTVASCSVTRSDGGTHADCLNGSNWHHND
jgi:hypothetical protein